MQEITIRVTPEAAATYLHASEEERLKLDALLSLRLTEAAQRNRPLRDVIREMSAEAQARGLTPENSPGDSGSVVMRPITNFSN